MRVTIRNDFHGREATARPDPEGWLTRRQVARLKHELCGATGCTCSGEYGQRSAGNPHEIDARQVASDDSDQRQVRLDVADLSSPAALLGARGGRAGTGASQARTSEQARAAVNARWAKRKGVCACGAPEIVPPLGKCGSCCDAQQER